MPIAKQTYFYNEDKTQVIVQKDDEKRSEKASSLLVRAGGFVSDETVNKFKLEVEGDSDAGADNSESETVLKPVPEKDKTETESEASKKQTKK